MNDYVKEMREQGTIVIPKEVGQAAGTFMPHNAAAMLACTADCDGFWSIHPSVKRELYMWGVYYDRSPYSPSIGGNPSLFGLPVRFDNDREQLGIAGDVVFLCKDGAVKVQTRD